VSILFYFYCCIRSLIGLHVFSFPHSDEPTDYDLSIIPVVLDHPSHSQPISSIEQLPLELLIQITSYLPFTSLLFFSSTSRRLRSKLFRFSSDRDAVARAWVERSAPWYLPYSGVSVETLNSKVVIGWAYLRRCLESGSMKNRRRIWKVAEQLGNMADELAL
jgi:F-box domain